MLTLARRILWAGNRLMHGLMGDVIYIYMGLNTRCVSSHVGPNPETPRAVSKRKISHIVTDRIAQTEIFPGPLCMQDFSGLLMVPSIVKA